MFQLKLNAEASTGYRDRGGGGKEICVHDSPGLASELCWFIPHLRAMQYNWKLRCLKEPPVLLAENACQVASHHTQLQLQTPPPPPPRLPPHSQSHQPLCTDGGRTPLASFERAVASVSGVCSSTATAPHMVCSTSHLREPVKFSYARWRFHIHKQVSEQRAVHAT